MNHWKMLCCLATMTALGAAQPTFAQQGPVAGETVEGSLAGKSMTFASWGGIFQEGQMKALEDFVAKSGVTLYEDGPAEQSKVKAQVESGNVLWDVVVTSNYLPFVECGKLFLKLDFSKIDVSKVPEGQVGECSVPAMNYGTLLMYNKDTYGDNPPTSWADFFDTEKFPGKRAIPGYSDAEGFIVELAFLAEGMKQEDMFPADIDRALDKYRAMRDDLILWTTGAESEQLMESGEADMVMGWTGRGLNAIRNGANFAPVWKDWVVVKDQVVVPVGVKDPDASFALINAYLGAEAQAKFTEVTSYSPINVDAKPQLDELGASFLSTAPDKLAQAYEQNIPYWVEHYDELLSKWAEFLAGN